MTCRISILAFVCLIIGLEACKTQKPSPNDDYLKGYVIQNCKEYAPYFNLSDCDKITFLDSLYDKNGKARISLYEERERCFMKMILSLSEWEKDSTHFGVYEAQYFYTKDSFYYEDSKRLRAKYGCD